MSTMTMDGATSGAGVLRETLQNATKYAMALLLRAKAELLRSRDLVMAAAERSRPALAKAMQTLHLEGMAQQAQVFASWLHSKLGPLLSRGALIDVVVIGLTSAKTRQQVLNGYDALQRGFARSTSRLASFCEKRFQPGMKVLDLITSALEFGEAVLKRADAGFSARPYTCGVARFAAKAHLGFLIGKTVVGFLPRKITLAVALLVAVVAVAYDRGRASAGKSYWAQAAEVIRSTSEEGQKLDDAYLADTEPTEAPAPVEPETPVEDAPAPQAPSEEPAPAEAGKPKFDRKGRMVDSEGRPTETRAQARKRMQATWIAEKASKIDAKRK